MVTVEDQGWIVTKEVVVRGGKTTSAYFSYGVDSPPIGASFGSLIIN